MADKTKLVWKPINLGTSKAIAKVFDAETKAAEQTNLMIVQAAAKAEKVDASRIKVGRMWGKISYAVLPEGDAAGTSAAAVTLG